MPAPIRYLDVWFVLVSAPLIVIAGLPLLGYVIGAAAWLSTRLGVEAMYARAARTNDSKARAGLQVGAMMTRLLTVVLAVIIARYTGGKDDGVMAAALALAAFTVYFILTLVQHGGREPNRKPSPS